jgi:hypothetical protein
MSKGRKVPDPAPIDHAANLRERLGRVVREAWIAWAKEQKETKDSWLSPWEELAEPFKEADRRIGQAVLDTITGGGAQRGEFATSSIYGYASKEPYVNLEVSVSPMQLSPAKARECALMLLESADASESDAVLIGYARDVLDLDMQGAAQLLNQFRQYREKQRGTEAQSA